jgi:hypothetical protein
MVFPVSLPIVILKSPFFFPVFGREIPWFAKHPGVNSASCASQMLSASVQSLSL